MSGMFGETNSLAGGEWGGTSTRSDRGVPIDLHEQRRLPGHESAYGQAVLRGTGHEFGDVFIIPDTDEPVEQPPREDA